MAKDVNLMDDEGGGPGGGGKERPKGGGALKIVLIGLVVVGLLGGSGAAGYYFWWLPRQRAKLQTQKAAEERRQKQLEEARRETERRQRELEALRRVREMAAAPKLPEGGRPPAAAPGAPGAPGGLIQPISPEERRAAARPAPRRGEELISKEVKPPSPPGAKPPARRPPERAARPPRPTPGEKPAPPPRAARRPDAAPGTYSVRVAACVTQSCVRVVQQKMKAKGLETYVGQARTRLPLMDVVAGQFAGRDQAERLARDLRGKGLKPQVVRLGEGRYRVSLGAFLMVEDAHLQLDRLEEAGFSGTLETRPGLTALREVRVGRFSSRAEALEESRKLRQRGIETVVVQR